MSYVEYLDYYLFLSFSLFLCVCVCAAARAHANSLFRLSTLARAATRITESTRTSNRASTGRLKSFWACAMDCRSTCGR